MFELIIAGVVALSLIALSFIFPGVGKRFQALAIQFWPGSTAAKKSKKLLNGQPVSTTYEDVFPPDRRSTLADLRQDALSKPGKSGKELGQTPPDYSKCLPDKENAQDADGLQDHVTPTGFTVAEIKRLGDFPDYATLSGIPLPAPCTDFDIEKAVPRPYRPFRWPYFQTMSLMKLEQDYWLELENTYVERIKQRQELYEKNKHHIIQSLPGSELAAKELMEVVIQFLCARYPMYFHLDDDKVTFHNRLLDTTTNLKTTAPLIALLDNVPEDFAIMVRDPETGIYSFRGGMICSAVGWSLGSKIGKKVAQIHAPVPDYKKRMEFSMDRYFAKQPTDEGIQRGSWGLEIGKPLFLLPDDDKFTEDRAQQDPDATIDQYHLRVDWQTLRRLPLSGAIVFNFKCVFTNVMEFRDEPYIPTLVLKLLREGNKAIMEYKGTYHTEHVVIPAFELWEKEQIEKGLIERDWDPHTLDASPFFPGWEEKWHRQQGF